MPFGASKTYDNFDENETQMSTSVNSNIGTPTETSRRSSPLIFISFEFQIPCLYILEIRI